MPRAFRLIVRVLTFRTVKRELEKKKKKRFHIFREIFERIYYSGYFADQKKNHLHYLRFSRGPTSIRYFCRLSCVFPYRHKVK